jgi:hypothetical protein
MRFRIGSGTRVVEVHFGKPSRIDSWSTRAAAWAQVLTLIVVVVGYFYTVVPAFQKERLSEEVSRLEIEREKSASDISAINANVVQMRLVLDGMRKSRDQLKTENTTLQTQQKILLASASDADNQRLEATRRVALEERKLKETNNAYLNAIRDSFALDFQMSLFPLLDHGVDFSEGKSQKSLASEIDSEVGDPLGKLAAIIDGISSRNAKSTQNDSVSAQAFRQVLSEFQKHFRERKSNIIIAQVDANLWASTYLDQMAKAKAGEPQCVSAYWEGLAKSKKWTESQLKQLRQDKAYSPKQGAIFQRYCNIMAEYAISTSFRKAWGDYSQEFIQRFSSIPDAIMNDVHMKPFPDNLVYPPKFQGGWMPEKEAVQFQE